MMCYDKTRKGFTLIELLVVISIIALLLSILMPALTKVKEQGRRVVCGSQMKTVGTVMAMYQNANKYWLPPNAGYETYCKPFYQPHFFGNYRIYTGIDRGEQGAAILAPYVSDPMPFFCPSSEETARIKKQQKRGGGDSFANPYPYRVPPVQIDRNGNLISFRNYPWDYLTYNYAVGWNSDPFPTLNGRKVKLTRSDLRNGKTGIMFVDLIMEKATVQTNVQPSSYQRSGKWANHLKTSKGPGGNRLLTDGSCAWAPWREEMSEFYGSQPNGWIYW